MKPIGVGIQSFEKFREKDVFYVDKTQFIRDWYLKNEEITLITRPRRFGKTLTLDMLYCFFSPVYADRKDLFEGLQIREDSRMMALQGSIPTIRISFASVKSDTFIGFLKGMASAVSGILGDFLCLLDSEKLSEDDKELIRIMRKKNQRIPSKENEKEDFQDFVERLENSLAWLSERLYFYYGKKVLILIDEYDTPLQSAWMNQYYEEAIAVMRELFFRSLKGNQYLERALLTGITRIAKESLFSDLNNFVVYSVLHSGYDTAFGFTQQEMQSILEDYDISQKAELLRNWYDGFTIGQETDLYNPWSVTCFLSNRNLPPEDYWAQSGGTGLIDFLVKRGSWELLEGFETLLQGGTIRKKINENLIFPDLLQNESAVWSLLISAGYLKPVPKPAKEFAENPVLSMDSSALQMKEYKESRMHSLTITNREAFISFAEMIDRWFSTSAGNSMEKFARALLADDCPEMNRQMQQVVLQCASSFDSGVKPSNGTIQPENFFHGLTLGMLTCLLESYHLTSNRESGLGRYDICLEPISFGTGNAYILEFKVFSEIERDQDLADTAKRARNQIEEKQYDAELLAKGFPEEKIHKYGFGFRGKEVFICS